MVAVVFWCWQRVRGQLAMVHGVFARDGVLWGGGYGDVSAVIVWLWHG